MPKPTYKTTHQLAGAARGLSKVTISVGHREKQEYANAIEGVNYRHVFVEDCKRTGELELWIDVRGLLRAMGPDALRSKSRAAKRVNGLVQVRAVNVTEVKS